MVLTRSIGSLAAAFLFGSAFAQLGSGEIKTEVVNGHIFVQARINRQSVRLAVDTGAQMNALTPEAAKRLGIASGQKVQANGVGSKTIDATISKIDLLEVGSSGSVGEPVVIIPLPAELNCDGLVGYGFLRHFVTTIDYDRQTIRFQKPEDFVAPLDSTRLELEFRNGIPEVQGSVEGIAGQFSLDTGANGQLALFSPFVDSHKLREKYPNRITAIAGSGVGGSTMGDVVRMSHVKLGNIELPPLVVNLAHNGSGVFSTSERIGNVSADILTRFRITFDYPGKRLFLVKGPQFDKPSDWNRAGFFVSMSTGKAKVAWVLANSPASEADIKLDDEITELNGKGVSDWKQGEIKESLRGPAGTTMKLKILRGGQVHDVQITLRDLVK
jgi:predicted aspartyl protease